MQHKFGFLVFIYFVVFTALMTFVFAITAHAEPVGALNPGVTQSNIKQTICVPGYTATIRPSSSYTNAVKRQMLKNSSGMALYELDHFIPLSIGGAPKDKQNLWPQPWAGTCNAKDKDRLEVALKTSVCKGKLTLLDAQKSVIDWRKTYRQQFGRAC